MSGHSKWATIKRQKGAQDAKRGQLFTKLSNAIAIAVREGGGVADPEFNFKLRIAIEKARAANMPKENIERSIEKAKGGAGRGLEAAVYEGFAPEGVGVIVHTVTDNKQRTVSEMKNIFEKSGGTLGSQGSVAYLFAQMGELVVKKSGKSTDDILSIALETGVEDVEEEDTVVFLYTDPSKLAEVKKAVEESGLLTESAELIFKPKTTLQIEDPNKKEKLITFLEKVEDQSDVQRVYSNVEFVSK